MQLEYLKFYKNHKKELNKISEENNQLKELLPKETNEREQVKIVNRAKGLKEEFYKVQSSISAMSS